MVAVAVARAVLVEAGRNWVHFHNWPPTGRSGSSCCYCSCCYCSCCCQQQAPRSHTKSGQILGGQEAADTDSQSCSVRVAGVHQTGPAFVHILAEVDHRLVEEVADRTLGAAAGEVADRRKLVEEEADRTKLVEEEADRKRLEEEAADRTQGAEEERLESSCCTVADHTAREDRR